MLCDFQQRQINRPLKTYKAAPRFNRTNQFCSIWWIKLTKNICTVGARKFESSEIRIPRKFESPFELHCYLGNSNLPSFNSNFANFNSNSTEKYVFLSCDFLIARFVLFCWCIWCIWILNSFESLIITL